MDNNETQVLYRDENDGNGSDVKEVLAKVYAAMTEKNYNVVNQLVQYIMSGEPLFITNHKGARSLITKVERDEIVEELIKSYIEKNYK